MDPAEGPVKHNGHLPPEGTSVREVDHPLLTSAQASLPPVQGAETWVTATTWVTAVGQGATASPVGLALGLGPGHVRGEPEGGRDRSRLMSRGQFVFKPDSSVLKYERILSLWPVEPSYWQCRGTTRSLSHSSVARSGPVISIRVFPGSVRERI